MVMGRGVGGGGGGKTVTQVELVTMEIGHNIPASSSLSHSLQIALVSIVTLHVHPFMPLCISWLVVLFHNAIR